MKNKDNSMPGIVGRIMGTVCAICLGICVSALAIIATIKFVMWLWLI